MFKSPQSEIIKTSETFLLYCLWSFCHHTRGNRTTFSPLLSWIRIRHLEFVLSFLSCPLVQESDNRDGIFKASLLINGHFALKIKWFICSFIRGTHVSVNSKAKSSISSSSGTFSGKESYIFCSKIKWQVAHANSLVTKCLIAFYEAQWYITDFVNQRKQVSHAPPPHAPLFVKEIEWTEKITAIHMKRRELTL